MPDKMTFINVFRVAVCTISTLSLRFNSTFTTYVTSSILEVCSVNNQKAEITGVLCQGSGIYMQVIEGQRSVISALFSKIIADKRHNTVELLSVEEIQKRQYGQWSMALVQLSINDPMVQLAHPEFDPYSASSKDAIRIIDELIKSSSPIETMRT